MEGLHHARRSQSDRPANAGPSPYRLIPGWRITILAIALLSASACAGKRVAPAPGTDVAGSRAAGVAEPADRARLATLSAGRGQQHVEGGYRIGPDDLLDVRIPDLIDAPPSALAPSRPGDAAPAAISGAPTFAQGVRVSGTGDVTLPYLGQMHADGLTPTELEHEIASRLVARGILRAPQVAVTVIEYRSRVVAVIGAVERPGVFPATRPNATVSDLIWAAGGPSKDAGRVVQFTPAEDGGTDGHPSGRAPIRLDLTEILQPSGDGALAANLPVKPGDVISVSPAGNVTVQGWVDKPGAYPITRGLSLSGAVAAAGGPTFAADRRHATLRHALATGEQRVSADLVAISKGETPDIAVSDGDVVEVPVSVARVVPWGAWQAISALFRVGGSIAVF